MKRDEELEQNKSNSSKSNGKGRDGRTANVEDDSWENSAQEQEEDPAIPDQPEPEIIAVPLFQGVVIMQSIARK